MSAFKPGDRVHVEFDAIIQSGSWPYKLDHDYLPVRVIGTNRLGQVNARNCTLIRAPLAVGDVLTADDPEPPIGTIGRDNTARAWVRNEQGWCLAESRGLWHWPLDLLLTVLYVPEDTP